MTTRLIQMDIIQLNIGSNPCTTAKHFVLFLLLYTLTIVPSISFIIFTLLSKPPLITKQVEQSGWTLTHVGCNANIQNQEMREPIVIAVQASHYTTLPLPFAFQYPQYINHFPFVSSLCQSESQHTSSTSSPKTLTKKKKPKPTLTTTELNPTSLSLSITRILNSDPNGGEFFGFSRFHCRVGIHPVHQDPGPDLPPWTPTGSWQSRFVTDSKTLLLNSNSMKC